MEFSPINLPANQALDLAYQTLFTFEDVNEYYIDYKCMNAFAKFSYNAYYNNDKRNFTSSKLFSCFVHTQQVTPESCSLTICVEYLTWVSGGNVICSSSTVIAEFMRRFSAELPG